MKTNHTRAAVMILWVITIGAIGYASGTASLAGWLVIASVSLLPVAVMLRLWRPPAETLSETIQSALR